MGLRTPASWIQGGSHTAENDRLTANAEVTSAGVISPGDFAVAAHGTPNMSVDVAAGAAYVKGSVTATQGYYKAVSDATVNVAVSAADATNPRIDIVCVTVRDAQYAGANNDVILQVVAGTPAGTPVAPSAPANAYVLAQIAVAANATAITNGNITDKRGYAGRVSNVTVCTSSSRPSNPRPGQEIWETDTNSLAVYSGSVWFYAGNSGPWTSTTPSVSQTSTIALSGASFMRYQLNGKTLRCQLYAVCATTAGASGNLIWTPPAPARDQTIPINFGTFQILGSINKSGIIIPFNTSNLVKFLPSGTNVNIGNGDGYTMQAGDILTANVEYETA